jgi:DNA-binding NarL/FixJ family response regulator
MLVETRPVAPGEQADDGLRERERAALRLFALGYSNKQAAKLLDVSVKTVESHKFAAMRKLGLGGMRGAVRYAVRRGWLREEYGEPRKCEAEPAPVS